MRTLFALALLASLALACGGSVDEVEIDSVPTSVATPVEIWLPAEHPAAPAQERWGLPIPCTGLRVVETSLEKLQPLCNSPEELAVRPANVHTEGCYRRGVCEIDLAAELEPARRDVVLTHELGHLLDFAHGGSGNRHLPTGEVCPEGGPGAALMCAGGPANGSPDPTAADFDLVLNLGPAVAR
jgi:hypothetical protein